jgi:hypothetical protein
MANDRDEIAVTTRLHPNDAEAVLGVLVGDALDQPSKHLPVGRMWLRLHGRPSHRSGRAAGRNLTARGASRRKLQPIILNFSAGNRGSGRPPSRRRDGPPIERSSSTSLPSGRRGCGTGRRGPPGSRGGWPQHTLVGRGCSGPMATSGGGPPDLLPVGRWASRTGHPTDRRGRSVVSLV